MLKWWRICKDQGEAKMESQVSQVQVLLLIISTTIMQQYLLIQRLLWFSIVWIDCLHLSMLVKVITWYSRSCSCDLFHKQPALGTTSIVKLCMNCDLSFFMKSSCWQPPSQHLYKMTYSLIKFSFLFFCLRLCLWWVNQFKKISNQRKTWTTTYR